MEGLGLGLTPAEFWSITFFELGCMSRAIRYNDERDWWHTASLMALHANVNRDAKKTPKPYQASDFHPYAEEKLDRGKAKFVRGLSEVDIELHREWAQKIRMKNGS